MNLNIALISLLLLTLFSCNESKEPVLFNPPLKEKQFIDVLTEIHLVDALSKQKLLEDNRDLKVKFGQYNGVLEKHGVTRAQFDSTFLYYSQKPIELSAVYDSILARYVQIELELEER
jgi:hypothetical protein